MLNDPGRKRENQTPSPDVLDPDESQTHREKDLDKAWRALSRVIDPEVGLNIVCMGLVYSVEMWDAETIHVDMTLTTPACPMGTHIQSAAEAALASALPDYDIDLALVWDPPWSPSMISKEGLAELRGQRNR